MAPDEFFNSYLDIDDSDQESGESGSEELRKGGGSTKRAKLGSGNNSHADSEPRSDSEVEDDGAFGHPDRREPNGPEVGYKNVVDRNKHEELWIGTPREKGTGNTQVGNASKTPKLDKQAARFTLDAQKSGVVYLSRIPPFMKPQKLRSLLEPHGKINRLYLVPEDTEARKARLRNGGNKKLMYAEGWVEFVHKSDAKKACDILNARPIGGKKGSFYHDDIWTLLYLRGFKWHHLTEQMDSENKERENRMRAELEKSRREDDAFVKNVDKAKMIRNMDRKRKRHGEFGVDQTPTSGWRLGSVTVRKSEKTLQASSQTVLGKIL